MVSVELGVSYLHTKKNTFIRKHFQRVPFCTGRFVAYICIFFINTKTAWPLFFYVTPHRGSVDKYNCNMRKVIFFAIYRISNKAFCGTAIKRRVQTLSPVLEFAEFITRLFEVLVQEVHLKLQSWLFLYACAQTIIIIITITSSAAQWRLWLNSKGGLLTDRDNTVHSVGAIHCFFSPRVKWFSHTCSHASS